MEHSSLWTVQHSTVLYVAKAKLQGTIKVLLEEKQQFPSERT